MFKPLLHKSHTEPHVDAAPPVEDSCEHVPQWRDEASAPFVSVIDAPACCVVAQGSAQGGVEAGDVLHSVLALEVHACVEAELCSAPDSDAVRPQAAAPRGKLPTS